MLGADIQRQLKADGGDFCNREANGLAIAEFMVGDCYKTGQGVPRDMTQAVKWYGRAADDDDPSAQYNLGALFENGQGVRQDLSEAAKWYRKAADHGSTPAQRTVGEFLQKGRGVSADAREAARWYQRRRSGLLPVGGTDPTGI